MFHSFPCSQNFITLSLKTSIDMLLIENTTLLINFDNEINVETGFFSAISNERYFSFEINHGNKIYCGGKNTYLMY